MSQRRRWDVSKRYLKHSEYLFQTPPDQLERIIERYLKGFKEILPTTEVVYFYGKTAFQLEKNRLIEIEDVKINPDWASLTLLEQPTASRHQVVYNWVKLNDDKQQFLNLYTQVYTAKLQTWLKTPQASDGEAPSHTKPNLLKARYRRQKEVILAIERFAKKQSPGVHKEISELPELEEEIINFQNQLLNDLEQARSRLTDAQGKLHSMELFFGLVLDEVANKLRISQGLLGFLPKDNQEGSDFQAKNLIDTRLQNLTDFAESLALSLESQTHFAPEKVEHFTFIEAVHQSLSQFAQSEGNHNCEFKFNQTLGNCELIGDPDVLALGLIRLFQFALALQEYETTPGVLTFKIKAKVVDSGVESRIEVSGLQLSERLKGLIGPSKEAYEKAPAGFIIPIAMMQIVSRTFERQGSVAFLVRENGRLDINVNINRPTNL